MKNYKEMGKRIKNKRTELGITQEKLSEIIDVSPSYISEIERGTSICSIEVLVNIAKNLELNLDYLVNGIVENNADFSFSEILKDVPKEYRKLYVDVCINIKESFKK